MKIKKITIALFLGTLSFVIFVNFLQSSVILLLEFFLQEREVTTEFLVHQSFNALVIIFTGILSYKFFSLFGKEKRRLNTLRENKKINTLFPKKEEKAPALERGFLFWIVIFSLLLYSIFLTRDSVLISAALIISFIIFIAFLLLKKLYRKFDKEKSVPKKIIDKEVARRYLESFYKKIFFIVSSLFLLVIFPSTSILYDYFFEVLRTLRNVCLDLDFSLMITHKFLIALFVSSIFIFTMYSLFRSFQLLPFRIIKLPEDKVIDIYNSLEEGKRAILPVLLIISLIVSIFTIVLFFFYYMKDIHSFIENL